MKPLWDTVWRFEWYYEKNRPLNLGTDGDKAATYGWTRRNILGGALQCSKYIQIPWFTESVLANNSQMNVALTYFYEKILNFKNDLVVDRPRSQGRRLLNRLAYPVRAAGPAAGLVHVHFYGKLFPAHQKMDGRSRPDLCFARQALAVWISAMLPGGSAEKII